MNITTDTVNSLLQDYLDPYLQKDYVSLQWIKELIVEPDKIKLHLQLGYPAATKVASIKQALTGLLQSIGKPVEITVDWKIIAHATPAGIDAIPAIKNIIAVASGKGGVGKSTTAVNLALALSGEGARVGILDADIYGPSQPLMLGVQRKPDSMDGKTMEPILAHGLQVMSIGFLVDADTAMIWRGPMVSGALQQLLNDTNWQALDYLIIDLPPGTGDIQLTMAQKIPVTGGVIITTPQDIALQDAKRGLQMFRKVNVPVLGIVENMSFHRCRECGHQEAIFGSGGGERFAEEYGVPLLGQLPLELKIREQTDSGNPTVVSDPESASAELYREIARRVAALLSLQPKSMKSKFPKIVVK